jgi:hypothetical protein
MVDLVGIEPTTSSMPWKRAPSCATGPFHQDGKATDREINSRLHGLDSQTTAQSVGIIHFAKTVRMSMLNAIEGLVRTMNRASVGMREYFLLLPLFLAAASAQSTAPNQQPPVPYSSANQLNQLLTQLEQVSQSTQVDLAGTRIDRWKTDANTKRQTQANVESVERNLKTALPEIIGQMRNSPENLAASFRLYRNLDALYDVLSSVVEAAGAFGSKDEFQALDNDFNTIESARRSLAERMQGLAESKETELVQLRTQVRNAQQNAVAAPPKKVIVDDTEPVKKPPTKKKAPAKTPPKPSGTTPATGTPAPKPQPPAQ